MNASLREVLQSSPRQTFLFIPLALLGLEMLLHQGKLRPDWRFAPLTATGYGLYRFGGSYRARMGAGGPGFRNLPTKLLTCGPYAWSRNPMYAGHIVFTLGLALTLRSALGFVALAERMVRFDRRIRKDETRLGERFGDEYIRYTRRVRRWVPGVL